MVIPAILNHFMNPLIPEIWKVNMILLIDFQAVTLSVEQVGKGRYYIDGVPGNNDHLVGFEVRRSRDVLWVVRLGDPYPVRITRNVLT